MSQSERMATRWKSCRKVAHQLRQHGVYVSSALVFKHYAILKNDGHVTKSDGVIDPKATLIWLAENDLAFRMQVQQEAPTWAPPVPAPVPAPAPAPAPVPKCDCKSPRSILNMACWFVAKCDTPQQARDALELAIKAQELMRR